MQFDTHRQFERQYKKVPVAIREKVWERLAMHATDPNHPLLRDHKLNPPWDRYRSVNLSGDYRLVYKKQSSDLYFLRAVGTHHQLFGT